MLVISIFVTAFSVSIVASGNQMYVQSCLYFVIGEFLKDINILCSLEFPNVFEKAELDRQLSGLKQEK